MLEGVLPHFAAGSGRSVLPFEEEEVLDIELWFPSCEFVRNGIIGSFWFFSSIAGVLVVDLWFAAVRLVQILDVLFWVYIRSKVEDHDVYISKCP